MNKNHLIDIEKNRTPNKFRHSGIRAFGYRPQMSATERYVAILIFFIHRESYDHNMYLIIIMHFSQFHHDPYDLRTRVRVFV